MKLITLATVLFALCTLVLSADPVPPPTWPPVWYTWVVTSVVKSGLDKPLYAVGQLVAFDTVHQWACRLNQQNLITPVPNRPVDFCDFKASKHYALAETSVNATCNGTKPIQGPLAPIAYPAEYLAAAKFLGVNKVAQKDCNHFYAADITINGQFVMMDVWTATDTSYPCQISVTDPNTKIVSTWAFDGFAGAIPQDAVNQCLAPKIMCAEQNYVCNVKPGTDTGKLLSALEWVCDPSHLDCTPIQPGGTHYIPNTLMDHSNWAFNAYYRLHRTRQGPSACDFNGIAQLIPPANATVVENPSAFGGNLFAVFPNNIICDA